MVNARDVVDQFGRKRCKKKAWNNISIHFIAFYRSLESKDYLTWYKKVPRVKNMPKYLRKGGNSGLQGEFQ